MQVEYHCLCYYSYYPEMTRKIGWCLNRKSDINFCEIIFTNIFVKLISRLNVNFAIISDFFLLQINLQLQKQFIDFAINLIKKNFCIWFFCLFLILVRSHCFYQTKLLCHFEFIIKKMQRNLIFIKSYRKIITIMQ